MSLNFSLFHVNLYAIYQGKWYALKTSMDTEIITSKEINKAIFALKQGIPIVFPTETVYGLGASIWMPEAIEKIFAIKGRPADNPLIVHISSMEEVFLLGDSLPPLFFLLAEKFWPGPLTLVVKKHPSVPSIVCGGLDSIAIRYPSNLIARELISQVGPMAAPSANISGRPSPTSALDVLEDLNGKIPWIIDEGASLIGIESTVVSLLGERPVLLRPGFLNKETIEEAVGEKILESVKDTPILSPGMKYRHYAPRAKVRLVYDPRDLKGDYILSTEPSLGMHLLNEQTLYAELRKADREGVSEIEIDCSSSLLKNSALMNRIIKASGG